MGEQFRTGYLDAALFDLPDVIAQARDDFASTKIEIDTLVGTGFSGALVVPMLATALGLDFVLVRKENDGSHHSGSLIGTLGSRWCFVDDFLCTGTTHRRVRDKIAEVSAERGVVTEQVATYLYVLMGNRTQRLQRFSA